MELCRRLDDLAETEVAEHEVRVVVVALVEPVLELQVPVADVVRVEVADGGHHLAGHLGSVDFGVELPLRKPLEELPTSANLHDKKHRALTLVDFEQLDDISVMDLIALELQTAQKNHTHVGMAICECPYPTRLWIRERKKAVA